MKAQQPDAWLRLVIQTMPTAELRKESQNMNNSDEERMAMAKALHARLTVRK
jgi:hypothetical protein